MKYCYVKIRGRKYRVHHTNRRPKRAYRKSGYI